jgi:glyoxylase-like metal-dependent hydrolase (beta-lactamase superfamily II)
MTVMAYALLGERVVLVDTGVAGQRDLVLGALTAAGRTPEDVSLILLTHGHHDHAGSALALKEATGAPIALGAGDEEKCLEGIDTEMHGRGFVGRTALAAIRKRQENSPDRDAGPVPDLVIDAETSLLPYGVDAVVVPTPGHSHGSLSVFTASGDALVGDMLGGGGRSRLMPRRGVFVSDEDAMEASIRAVIARAPKRVFTGHDEKPFTLQQMQIAFGDDEQD